VGGKDDLGPDSPTYKVDYYIAKVSVN